jgi:hypothetical protein
MIQGDFCNAEGAEAVGFSHGQFGFVVQALGDASGELLFGSEMVEDQFSVGAQGPGDFSVGAMRERMARWHQSSKNLATYAGELYSQKCWKFGADDRALSAGFSASNATIDRPRAI